jgi:hypothetical protein
MTLLQIEDLLTGVATGNFIRKVGSQFGTIWQFDGLLAREASLEEYAAFGAARNEKICVGLPVAWMGRTWSTILVYHRVDLCRVNIHTDVDNVFFADVHARLESQFGKGRKIQSPEDAPLTVLRRTGWLGKDGAVFLVRTPTYLQVTIGGRESLQESKTTC